MATIRVPDIVPSPAEDCQLLHKSFEGFGTDEKAIIKILGRRNESQRRKIREAYQQLYNKPLVDRLFSELSGDFRKGVMLWTYDPAERDARLANESLLKSKRNKSLTQLQVIVEIACSTSPHHLIAVRKAYCFLFDCSLEEDIVSHVSLPVQKILVSLVRSYRYDKEAVDPSLASIEAAILYGAIEEKRFEDEDFINILSTRNTFQLRETFKCYHEAYGKSIDRDIMDCGKGLVESVLKVVVWCIDSPEKHYAEVIRSAIVGIGTDEDTLTRAIVSRAEVDMVNVRAEYFNSNKSSLDNAVIGDTSGDYKDFLLTLLGANV